ncbi:MAG: hypothetical protein O3A01_08750 [bacterium]|nr:hypothetical protein [bacterium]
MKRTTLLLLILIVLPSCNDSKKPDISSIPKVKYLTYVDYKANAESKNETKNTIEGFNFSPPPHWQNQDASGMRLLSYVITEKEKIANFTLIKLVGRSGSILENVNRWRGQLELKPLTNTLLSKAINVMPSQVGDFQFIDIQRIQKRGEETDRILAAILHKDGSTYFFKLMGPHNLVGNEKANFVEFLEKITTASTQDKP